jgi:glutamate-1-semialdehyde 2,1-aminomutase
MGTRVQAGWRSAADRVGLPLEISGIPPLGHFSIQGEQKQAARTLFTQMMLERGFLASNAFYATYAHQDQHVEAYLEAVQEVFAIIAQALETKTILAHLKGPVAHDGFRRLT